MTFTGVTGRQYSLGKDIAQGGEGTIYSIVGDPSKLAKLYHPKARSGNIGEKILNMVKEGHGESFRYIAWPLDVLFDESHQVRGFVMKKFNGVKSLADQLPEKNLDWFGRVTAAHNLCDVVREIHGMHQCIGDMNPSNFGVDPANGHVYAFDADSFHYRTGNGHFFPCVVGLPEYYAPELQRKITHGQDMRTLDPSETFSLETDRFALAVLIFQLLFAGYHPFTARLLEHCGSSVVVHRQSTNILNKTSPYFNPQPGTGIPVGAPPLSIIPDEMKAMFRKAFLTETRPTAVDWQRALFDLLQNLKKCSKNHYYYNKLNGCPWCILDSGNSSHGQQHGASSSTKTPNGQASSHSSANHGSGQTGTGGKAVKNTAAKSGNALSGAAGPIYKASSSERRGRYLYEKALWWWYALFPAFFIIDLIVEELNTSGASAFMDTLGMIWMILSAVPAVMSFAGRPYNAGGKSAPKFHWLLFALEGFILLISVLAMAEGSGTGAIVVSFICRLILMIQLIRDR